MTIEHLSNPETSMELAREAIDRGHDIAHDVARDCGQMFGNVSHMSWFVIAVATRIDEDCEHQQLAS